MAFDQRSNAVLTAHRTPGHTPGCTTWVMTVRENGEEYDLLIVCSYGANDNYRLVNNPDASRD